MTGTAPYNCSWCDIPLTLRQFGGLIAPDEGEGSLLSCKDCDKKLKHHRRAKQMASIVPTPRRIICIGCKKLLIREDFKLSASRQGVYGFHHDGCKQD